MDEQKRTPGPYTSGGFPTTSGTADDKAVNWIGDDARADQLEAQFAAASVLMKLMLRNAYTLEGLAVEEIERAWSLIEKSEETDVPCWMCDRVTIRVAKAIADTGICKGHNLYALAAKK